MSARPWTCVNMYTMSDLIEQVLVHAEKLFASDVVFLESFFVRVGPAHHPRATQQSVCIDTMAMHPRPIPNSARCFDARSHGEHLEPSFQRKVSSQSPTLCSFQNWKSSGSLAGSLISLRALRLLPFHISRLILLTESVRDWIGKRDLKKRIQKLKGSKFVLGGGSGFAQPKIRST